MADVRRIDLLDPAEVARLGGIEIVAPGVVEGFLAGIHRSPFRGFSVEFTEHRAYQPGDEPRYLDWKMLARSDRLFVKQFEEETNLRAMILVDASRSMAWRGAPARLTKRAYGDRLAAALALILLRQRDATGLITFDEAVREVVPARVKSGQWARLVRGLVRTPDGRGTAAQGPAGAARARGPGLRPAVRPRPRAHGAALPAPPRPSGDRRASDGSGRGRALGTPRGAVPRSRVGGQRGGAAARAGPRVRRDGAARDRGVAHGMPAARDRLPSCLDGHAVRYGAAAAGVTFLHPLALVGLVAAAIPALLHLLERRVPPEAEFPPLRYLSEAERQSARRLKLRHLLLLILRTLLIVLIVLAAARPLVPARTGGATVHAPTALAVILDNSASSGVVVDGRPVLDRLRAVARGSLARTAAGDRVWLILADGVARGGVRERLLATVDSAAVSPRRLDLSAAVQQAARLVDAEPLPAREAHVVSDLQRTALGAGRADVPRGVRVLALAPPPQPPANRGIGTARVTDGAVTVGVVGTPGAAAAAVTVRVRGREVGRALAAPGAAVSIALPPLAPGWWVGEARLDPDELRADDRRVFAWRVASPARVTAPQDAGPFVAAALAVLAEGGKVGIAGAGGAGGARGPDVSIGERPDGRGGARTNVVIPPVDAALVGQVNRALAAGGGPWRFGGPGTPGPIAASSVAGIDGIQVTRRYRLEGGEDSTVVARVNGEPWLVRDPGEGRVLLLGSRLDTAWTALPAAPAFVPFVDALVNRLARGEAPVAEAEGAPRVEFRTRGTDTVGATVYGIDARESELAAAPPALVRRLLGAEVLEDPAFAAARFAGTGRADGSWLLLALALVVAVVELGVATLTRRSEE